MTEIQQKLMAIVPPDDYQHRYDFSNHSIIDGLTKEEREQVEDALIQKLYVTPEDMLIVGTLAYMKSIKALPALRNSLRCCKIQLQKIITAVAIYSLNQDEAMIHIAINAFNKVHEKWDLTISFAYLGRFDDARIVEIIKRYTDHPDFLVSHNAKRALGLQ